jgi:hypothetical protein
LHPANQTSSLEKKDSPLLGNAPFNQDQRIATLQHNVAAQKINWPSEYHNVQISTPFSISYQMLDLNNENANGEPHEEDSAELSNDENERFYINTMYTSNRNKAERHNSNIKST